MAGFRIEAVLGQGASGIVYRAATTPGRVVALKVLNAGLAADDRFRRRFLREATLAAQLEHPNVVPVVATGEDAGVLYLAMAYVDGVDLRTLIRDGGAARAASGRSRCWPAIADALDAAHAVGLVHRDVTPGNILSARVDGHERAYLGDFGLARHASTPTSLTGERSFVGTIDYIAPEQIRGDQLDGRADQYSLACVLYECLTGAQPFVRDTDVATVFAHLNERPPPVSVGRHPTCRRRSTRVLARGLAKEPADRYADCRGAARRGPGGAARRRPRPAGARRRRRRSPGVGARCLVAAAVGGGVASRPHARRRADRAAPATRRRRGRRRRPAAGRRRAWRWSTSRRAASIAQAPLPRASPTSRRRPAAAWALLAGRAAARAARPGTGAVAASRRPAVRAGRRGRVGDRRLGDRGRRAGSGAGRRAQRPHRRAALRARAGRRGGRRSPSATARCGWAAVPSCCASIPRSGQRHCPLPRAGRRRPAGRSAAARCGSRRTTTVGSYEIDPATERIVARPKLHGYVTDLAVGGGAAWVTVTPEDRVYRHQPRRRQRAGRAARPGPGRRASRTPTAR